MCAFLGYAAERTCSPGTLASNRTVSPYHSASLPPSSQPCSNLVKLPSGSATPLVKPLPSFPLREGDAVVSANALPHTLLLLDIQQAALSGLLAGHDTSSSSTDAGGDEGSSAAHDSQASQLYCTVRLESGKAAGKPPPSAGTAGVPGSPGRPSPASTQRGMQGSSAHGSPAAPLRTRALALGSGGVVTWQERLVLALPMRPGQLADGLGGRRLPERVPIECMPCHLLCHTRT